MGTGSIIMLVFAGVLGFLGVVFIVVGIAIAKNWKNKVNNCTQKVTGKVVDIVSHTSSSGGMDATYTTSWYPIIEYEADGETLTEQSPYGSYESKYVKGRKVEVCYNPENHKDFYIVGDNIAKISTKVFTIVGTGELAVAIILVLIAFLILK